MRSLLPTLLAAAAVLTIAGPAAAQQSPLPIIQPDEAFAAYQAICLAQPGDRDKQVAVAKAAPYNLVLKDTSADGSMRFENGRIFVAIRVNATHHFCMAGGRFDPALPRKQIEDTSAPVLDKLGKRSAGARDSTIWSNPDVKPETIYMYNHISQGPITIGSWLTGVTLGGK